MNEFKKMYTVLSPIIKLWDLLYDLKFLPILNIYHNKTFFSKLKNIVPLTVHKKFKKHILTNWMPFSYFIEYNTFTSKIQPKTGHETLGAE
jgi:hypothetical protein